jgi:hypothetical protein
MNNLITLAHCTNWFHLNGSAIMDDTPCAPSPPYVGYQKCHVSALPEWMAQQPCDLRPMNATFCLGHYGDDGTRRRLQEPASGFPCNEQCVYDEKSGLCVDFDPVAHWGCTVCTPERPCLFDVRADESEKNNLASSHPAIVQQMASHVYCLFWACSLGKAKAFEPCKPPCSTQANFA